jgi:ferredoxin
MAAASTDFPTPVSVPVTKSPRTTGALALSRRPVQAASASPSKIRGRPPPGPVAPAPAAAAYAEIPSSSPERDAIDVAIECIGCGMCLSACTMVAANGRFPGPAALNRAFTVQRDRRDAAHDARWAALLSDDALARCHGQANCTEVCPMGLSPTDSIFRLRRMAVARLWGRP